MPTAYVHAGPHKTGTSALQAWLLGQEAALRAAGLWVPGTGRNADGDHGALARLLTGTLDPPRASRLRQAFAAERAEARGQDLILSAEALSDAPEDRILQRAIRRLQAMGYDVVVLMVLRNPFDLANARHTQAYKRLRGTPFDACDVDGPYYAFDALPRRVEGTGATLRLIPYRGTGELARGAMAAFGLEERLAGIDWTTPRRNVSTGALCTFAARRIQDAAAALATPPPRRALRALSHHLEQAAGRIDDLPFNGFSPADIAIRARRTALRHARLTPYLGAEGVAMLNDADATRRPQTPHAVDDLDPLQAHAVDTIVAATQAAAELDPSCQSLDPILFDPQAV